MADIRNKIKSWINKSESDAAQGGAHPPQSVSPSVSASEQPAALPADSDPNAATQTAPAGPVDARANAMSRMTSAEKSNFLVQEQSDAEKKLSDLTQELGNIRKKYHDELRKKEEEKIKLFAHLSQVDQKSQATIGQQQAALEKMQKESQLEIEALEKRLELESAEWAEEIDRIEKTKDEYSAAGEIKRQEKELEEHHRIQEQKKVLEQLEGQIEMVQGKIESEKRKYQDRLRMIENDNVAIQSQIQLKQASQKNQEQKMMEEFSTAQAEWEARVQALQSQMQQEKHKWQEALGLKEAEFRAIKMELEKKDASMRIALKGKKEDLLSALARAEARLKGLSEEAKKEKAQYERDLKLRSDEAERLKVELMLLDSQLKVETEKSESTLLSLQQEAANKIAFFENKIQEEVRLGQKHAEDKKQEIENLALQFGLKKNSLQEEFAQRKADLEKRKKELQEELKRAVHLLEKEREDHRVEVGKRDELIAQIKLEMGKNTDEMTKKREDFLASMDTQKQEMASKIAALEERAKIEKQGMNELLARENQALLEKKALLAKEQSQVQHVIKKQEDELSFEIQPIKNQIMDQRNRLEQERASREKILSAKDQIIQNLHKQKQSLQETIFNNLSQHQAAMEKEKAKGAERLDEIQKKWEVERNVIEQSISSVKKEYENVQNELSKLPPLIEAQLNAFRTAHQKELDALNQVQQSVLSQKKQEEDLHQSKLGQLQTKEDSLNKEFQALEKKFEAERLEQEAQAADLQKRLTKQVADLEGRVKKDGEDLRASLKAAEQEFESQKKTLADKKLAFENDKSSLEASWAKEKQNLDGRLAEIKGQYESQKAIWQKALADRVAQIRDFEQRIENQKTEHARTLVELADRRKNFEKEFEARKEGLERQATETQEDFSRKITNKKDEIGKIEQEIQDFVRRAQAEQTGRKGEIEKTERELEARKQGLQKEYELESKRWPELLEQKDQQIQNLKGALANNEAAFKSQWERVETEFQDFKKASAIQIQSLEKDLQEGQLSFEKNIGEKNERVGQLESERTKEENKANQILTQLTNELNKMKAAYEAEIKDLEKKIGQERSRFEQQSKVRESEIEGLQKNIDQKKSQHDAAVDARAKEVDQEKHRLSQRQEDLVKRIAEDRAVAQKTIRARDEDISKIQAEITEIKNEFHAQETKFKEQILKERSKYEGRIKDLSKLYEKDIDSQTRALQQKQKEFEKLSLQLNSWNETARLEDEKVREQWEEERSALEREIQDLETELAQTRTALDESIEKKTEEIKKLTADLSKLQQSYAAQLTDLKREKDNVANEEGEWEEKLKQEKARLIEEVRLSEREIERLKVQISLKETQANIERQKKEREIRWSRRPLEFKVLELRRKSEEKDRESKRRADLVDSERRRLLAEIEQVNEMVQSESKKREAVLAEYKAEVHRRVQDLRDRAKNENAAVVASLNKRRDELIELKDTFKSLDQSIQEMEGASQTVRFAELEKEIEQLEADLKEASLRPAEASLQSELKDLQTEIKNKNRAVSQERSKSEKLASKVKKELDPFFDATDQMNKDADAVYQKSVKAKSLMELGMKAFAEERYSEAQSMFSEASESDAKNPVCYQMLGLIYEKLHDKNKARNFFKKALELDPGNDFLKNHMNQMDKGV